MSQTEFEFGLIQIIKCMYGVNSDDTGSYTVPFKWAHKLMFWVDDGSCLNSQRKSNVRNGRALDETLNSLISMSCCLHVLQSIYIHQNIKKCSQRRSWFSPISINKQITNLPTDTATITQQVLESFFMMWLILNSKVQPLKCLSPVEVILWEIFHSQMNQLVDFITVLSPVNQVAQNNFKDWDRDKPFCFFILCLLVGL